MNKKTIFAFMLALGLAVGLAAQERSFSTLPMVQKPGVSMLADADVKDTPQYLKALEVYNRLVQARGDFRYPVPDFVMRREERQIAAMNYERLEVVLEETAYEVCATYGDEAEAAIAFLLGHELTHYYEKHGWRRGFVADHKDLDIGIKLDSLADKVANETEADYLGGFLSYSAGFGLFEKGDDLIAKLYKAYKLDQLSPEDKAKMEAVYPSLADRQKLAARSAQKLALLVDVFDMANLLAAIGNYTEAYEYYRYILMQYQSREIYNNLGVTAVLDALQYFNPTELKFRFPLELDLESSASKGDGMATNRNKLLRQAIFHFDAAISLDPDYAPAYLNKASAFALLGDNDRARFYADKEARQAAQKSKKYLKTAVDINILIGILDWREGKAAQTEAAFKAAADAGSALAAHNLKILRNEPIGTEQPTFGGLPRTERIDEQSIVLIANNDINPDQTLSISPQITFYQNTKQGANSRLFISQDNRRDEYLLLHFTGPGYAGKTARNIGLGDERAAIVEAYGEPGRTLETPRGEIMIYKSTIFILGPDGKLERWANYTTN